MSRHHSFSLDYDSPPKHLTVHSYHSKYQTISSLGNGSFGTVDLAKIKFFKFDLLNLHKNKLGTLLCPLEDSKCNTSNLVAIKTMKKKLPLLQEYSNVKEVKFILSVPSHPCLVQIYEMFIDDIQYQLHISMEALNQNLYQLIRSRRNIKFSPVTLKSILSQLLCAIRHIHKCNYFHRDVKPENILVIPTLHFYGSKAAIPPYRKNDNFIIKLGDYGLARHVSNIKPYTAYVSTRWYRSPEILLRQKWYSRPIDIWAFGAVAVETANFVPLFPGSNELDQIWKILKILGTPFVPEPKAINASYVVPLGGYWTEALFLTNKLGIKLPDESGMSIEDIVQHPDSLALIEVIQSCLKWDPLARADATEIAKMQYFKESITMMDTYFETDTVSMNTALNKLAGIPNSPSRKLLTPSKLQKNSNGTCNTTGSVPVFQDSDDGYENYFGEYIAKQPERNSSGNESYKLFAQPWLLKVNEVLGTRESEMEPRRAGNEAHDLKKKLSKVAGTKRSFTTFSLDSEEVVNL